MDKQQIEKQKTILQKQREILLKAKQEEEEEAAQTVNEAQIPKTETVGQLSTSFDRETRNFVTDSPVSLLEQVKEKKRMYMNKIIELDRIENELSTSQLEERLTAIKNHYYYI